MHANAIAPEALWIDLIEPSPQEEQLVETTFGIDVPTREEMREIEASNRMYEEAGAIYMTITIVTRLDTDLPESSQITFIIAKERLITNRYVDPLPFQRFISFAERHPNSCTSSPMILAGLIEAIVNRMADVLERVGADLDQLSSDVFSPTEETAFGPCRLTRHARRTGTRGPEWRSDLQGA